MKFKPLCAVGLALIAGLSMGAQVDHFIYTSFLDVSADDKTPAFRVSTEVDGTAAVFYERTTDNVPKVRGTFKLDDQGLLALEMNDDNRQPRIRFAVDKDGAASIQIIGRNGKPVWGVSVDENDGVIAP